jgi:hypothetical protein
MVVLGNVVHVEPLARQAAVLGWQPDRPLASNRYCKLEADGADDEDAKNTAQSCPARLRLPEQPSQSH